MITIIVLMVRYADRVWLWLFGDGRWSERK